MIWLQHMQIYTFFFAKHNKISFHSLLERFGKIGMLQGPWTDGHEDTTTLLHGGQLDP